MKQNPKATAYNLYFQTNLTQAQIAERAGVSTRTIYDWMKQGNWKTLKANSRLMPAQIVDDIYNHISHLNWKIKTRDFEDRYPSKEEAETLRKLISTIPKIKLNVSKGESAQSMINFVSWLQTRNNDAAIFISDYIDEYLHAGREKGLEPYEFEYDADQYYNPSDYPWRKEHSFEQRVTDDINNTSLPARPFDGRGASPAPEQSATWQPRQNTEQETQPEKNTTPLREASQAPEHSATACPDELSGWQPRQNTDQEEDQQKQEPNKNQTRSKSEARLPDRRAPQQPPNPTKPTNNQPPDLKKLPDLASGNKNNRKVADPDKGGKEPFDPNDPDFVQKVFASWQKEIDKSKRRRR